MHGNREVVQKEAVEGLGEVLGLVNKHVGVAVQLGGAPALRHGLNEALVSKVEGGVVVAVEGVKRLNAHLNESPAAKEAWLHLA